MNTRRLILSFIFITSITTAANAQTNDLTAAQILHEVQNAYNNAPIEQKKFIEDATDAIEQSYVDAEQEYTFKKMNNSDNNYSNSRKKMLICTTAKGAIVAGGRFGFCVDQSRNAYVLTGRSLGYTAGVEGSLIVGVVLGDISDLQDSYAAVTMGVSIAHFPENLVRLLQSGKLGIGVDMLAGENLQKTKMLALVGPSLGAMIDLSGEGLTLRKINF